MSDLHIGGMSCRQLAEEYGTPLYIYDEERIREQAQAAMDNFKSDMFETEVAFASKAFSSIYLFKMLSKAGLGLDVVSGGELYGAIRAGVDMNKVYFHGNNKGDEEMAMALEAGVGYFVIDNVMECRRLVFAAEDAGVKVRALLRVNPGISAHTHEYIMTSTPDSKFGIYVKDRVNIKEVIDIIEGSNMVELAGFHSHIGSQIVEAESFERATDTMTDFLLEMKELYGIDNMELSIGGGFGIKYVEEDEVESLGDMCYRMVRCAEDCIVRKGVNVTKLITEPGRSMVGEAGYSLYTIGDMKVSGDKHYIFVNGGMSDNIRPALYEAEYGAALVEKQDLPKTMSYCVAGKNCESGDVLIKSVKLPEAMPGDLLVLFSTGAYGYSMASNYNRLGRPAVVFVKDGKSRLVIRRETYSDQYRLEVGGEED